MHNGKESFGSIPGDEKIYSVFEIDKELTTPVEALNRRLKVMNAFLEDKIIKLQIELDGASEQVSRAWKLNEILTEQFEKVITERDLLKAKLESGVEDFDPKGYFRTLGVNIEAFRALSSDDVDTYLKRLRNAQAMVSHTDVQGGSHERMKAVNEAYVYLSDPRNRDSYGVK